MAKISIVYDQETGKFEGVKLDDEWLKAEDANTPENIKWLSQFNWVQHEHVELYHRLGELGKTICSIHVLCRLFKTC